MQNCILLRLIFSISVKISMFGLLLSGFPESLMFVLMISATLLISKTGIPPNGFLPIYIISGAPILFIDLRTHSMPIFLDLILGFVFRIQKVLTLFQSHGHRRIIGSFCQFIV